MANGTSLTVLQLKNDSHAYFDLHQEIFWQGGGSMPAAVNAEYIHKGYP